MKCVGRYDVHRVRIPNDPGIAAEYAKHLLGKLIAVAPQTVAEARYSALKSGWDRGGSANSPRSWPT